MVSPDLEPICLAEAPRAICRSLLLLNYSTSADLLSTLQSGFRGSYLAETAVLYILRSVDYGDVVALVYYSVYFSHLIAAIALVPLLLSHFVTQQTVTLHSQKVLGLLCIMYCYPVS